MTYCLWNSSHYLTSCDKWSFHCEIVWSRTIHDKRWNQTRERMVKALFSRFQYGMETGSRRCTFRWTHSWGWECVHLTDTNNQFADRFPMDCQEILWGGDLPTHGMYRTCSDHYVLRLNTRTFLMWILLWSSCLTITNDEHENENEWTRTHDSSSSVLLLSLFRFKHRKMCRKMSGLALL